MDERDVDHPVAIQKGAVITFSTLKADVMEAAVRLKDCRRAALVCQDSYSFLVGFLALLHVGAVLVLPHNNKSKVLESIREEFDLLVDDAFIENKGETTCVLAPMDPQRLSLLFFTSGSTGAPKKIFKNVDMLEKESSTLDGFWREKSGIGPVFSTVSHQHLYGLTFKLLWPLMTGRPFTAETFFHWEDLCTALRPGATIISSPAHLDRLEGLDPLPVSQRPKCLFSAGSLLSLQASQQTDDIFGCRPIDIFGSTETGVIATRCLIEGEEPWQALPGVVVGCNEEAQLVVQSPFAEPNGIETSDLIEQTPEGFHFRGRANRVVKIEGKRVALAQVEQSLMQLPFIQAARVTLLSGKQGHLVAVVIPSAKGQVALTDMGCFRFGRFLRHELSQSCEAAGLPRQWRFLDEPPVQALSKVPEADIHALFGETI